MYKRQSLEDVKKNLSKLLFEFTLPCSLEVSSDFKNASLNVLFFNAASLILGDTSYYEGEKTEELLTIWQKQTVDLLTKAGVDKQEATQLAADAVKLDKKMAKFYNSAEYNAQIENLYKTMSLSDFETKTKSFDLAHFIKENNLSDAPFVIAPEENYLNHFDELFNEENFAQLKGWLVGNFVNKAAQFLSDELRQAALPLSTALYGMTAISSDERFVYNQLKSQFDEVVGQYYGLKYLGAQGKADATELVQSIVEVYKERLADKTWLSSETKQKAIEKLNTLKLKVGYPEVTQAFYNDLEVKDNLYQTAKVNGRHKMEYNFAQLPKPVDHSVWLMSAIEANACYNPSDNDVTLPALVLQEPFYSLDQSRSANYGGVGTVIGHEISHAFDNNGAQFDKNGNMENWWSKEDYEEFNKRIKKEIELFDGVVVGDIKSNGTLTVSENIADQGGLSAVIAANKKDNGSSKELFKNYARIWHVNSKHEILQYLASSDVHSLPQARVNVQVQCQDEFYKAFDVKEGDGMWLDEDKRVRIW